MVIQGCKNLLFKISQIEYSLNELDKSLNENPNIDLEQLTKEFLEWLES